MHSAVPPYGLPDALSEAHVTVTGGIVIYQVIRLQTKKEECNMY